jgi:hypothetical protein
MAADSKGFYSNTSTLKQESRVIPKIYKSGAVYFSLSGVVSNQKRNLDISSLIHQQLKTNGDLTKAIQGIKSEIRKSLISYLSYNKINNPKLFDANLKSGTYITSIGIIAVKDSKPYAHIIGFKIVNAEKLGIIVEEDFASSEKEEPNRLFFLGKNNAINAYLDTVKKIEEDPIKFVDKLLGIQIAKTPESVGAPVDIIQLNSQEAIWIRRKPATPVEMN